MKAFTIALACLVVLLGTAAGGRADLAPFGGGRRPPPPPPPPAAPVVILVDDKAQEPRLEVPRKLLANLRASAEDGADDGTRRAEARPAWHTILAGIALSCSLALGGLWLVRARYRPGAKAALLLLTTVVLLGVGAGCLWADIPSPFGRPRPRPPAPAEPEKLPEGVVLSEKVPIQVVERGEAVRLIVPREQLARVLEKSAPAKDAQPGRPEDPASKK
jgi:hypothetical protein